MRPALPFIATVTLLTVLLRCGVSSLAVLIDLVASILVLVPVVAVGWLVLPQRWMLVVPLRWHLFLAAASGIGLTSMLIMLAGCVGCLHRGLWIAILVAGLAGGILRLRRHLQDRRDSGSSTDVASSPLRSRGSWLWVFPAVSLGLSLAAASSAPGVLWAEEGYGYDALEYHLEMPREYFDEGRIAYAPHNVYANFPANVEMLYLLAMIVYDDPRDIGSIAQMIHLLLGVLAVYAVWVTASQWSPFSGHVAGVIAATAGWFAYLAGLAYVENGLLFFGATAIAAFLGAAEGMRPPHMRWLLVAGLMAGFACGCKYTGVVMFAVPLVLAAACLAGSAAMRFRAAATVFAGTAIAFSPWLVKNVAMTGNPVFPLANTIFRASPPGWGDEQTAQWNRGHAPSAQDVNSWHTKASGRVSAAADALWRRTIADPEQRFGPVMFLLALAGLLFRKRGIEDRILLWVLLAQLLVWLFATHWFARFAVVMIVPLALLAGRSVGDSPSRLRGFLVGAAVIVGALWNLAFVWSVHQRECPGPISSSAFYDGHVSGYEANGFINQELPPDAKLLLVGESRAFYFHRRVDHSVVFNRNPFAEAVAAAESDGEIVEWLRTQGYTHVLVNWMEVRRLSMTYGFPSTVTPELFDRLESSGLSIFRSFTLPERSDRYVDVYAVSRS